MFGKLKGKYINLCDGIELHFYKNQLEGHMGPHALNIFNELQSFILLKGQTQDIEKIYEDVCQKYNVPVKLILVREMFAHSILILQKNNVIDIVPSYTKKIYKITGEKGMTFPFWISVR